MFETKQDKSFNELLALCGNPIDTPDRGLLKREYIIPAQTVLRTEWISPAIEKAKAEAEVAKSQEKVNYFDSKIAEVGATVTIEGKPVEELIDNETITSTEDPI